eukprot:gene3771-4293_t
MASGQYGCCPLPNAVCCSDRVHCCPTNYTCDLSSLTCNKDNRKIPMLKHKTAAILLQTKEVTSKVKHVMCPKSTQYCQDGSTCCLIREGEYECCPMKEAVCCADHIHCCPNGYTCDTKAGGCVYENHFVAFKVKTLAKNFPVGSVKCPGEGFRCPDGNTCCKVDKNVYGCCPMPNAECCSDGEHCCPHGFTCNVGESKCVHGDISVPMLKKVNMLKIKEMPMGLISANLKSQVGHSFCPDHKSSCPNSFTCCKAKSGHWACCPYPKAECCKDGVHCCPHDTTCDLATLQCNPKGGSTIIPLPMKQSTVAILKAGAIICPDGLSECPNRYTCCLLSSGMYGCCPYSNAVCCNDHVHCCPHATKCDSTSGMCISKVHAMVKLENKQPNYLIHMMSHNDVVCPDGKSSCADGYTCCKLASGDYGCCPLPEAVCCSDGVHCCPHGTTCDVSSGHCIKGDKFSAMLKKMTAKQVSENKVCPDGKSSCPSGSTCCKLASGGYGCCPYSEAVCCSDGKHCCPHGTTCELSSGYCKKGNLVTLMLEKIAATPISENKVCPDGKSSCPSGSTCCKLASGGYGCCPYYEAVCCSDGKHCCPHGTTCELSSGYCKRGNSVTLMLEKIAPKPISENKVCPDGKSSCPSGSTCCKLASGGYGCCPYSEAVCCSDGKHCCPHGTTCELSSGYCKKGNSVTLMLEKIAAKPISENKVCPDGKSLCPSGSTCCKLASGGYGCCPYSEAVCCSDGKHCCPHGTTCELSSGYCKKGNLVTLMLEKIAATPISENKVCPDGKSSCPSGSTCCKLASGGYGCCPYSEAVCCSDGKHCCPHGTTCELSSGYCKRGNSVTLMLEKIAAKPISENKVCPDGKSLCPSGSTCCKLASGGYGCCPYSEAVCCSDGVHCCPHGTTCDLSSGRCIQGDKFTAMLKKITGKQVSENKVCPDGKSSCPSGSTCCKLASGSYGCCPLPEAVCCSDGVHCCPNGYSCSGGFCMKGDITLKATKHVPAAKNEATSENKVCPDSKSACPSGSTCCKLASGGYGCCPYSEAVCCSDGKHCCPHGTTCELSSGYCKKGNSVTLMLEKIAAKPISENKVCPDGKSSCPSGSTCCKLASGSYGCCPLPEAVCCSDGVHCCPNGYSCSGGFCVKGDITLKATKHVAAVKKEATSENKVCPDGKSLCPSGSTCCKLASGGYGCCPYSEAVCCSDGVHCCPHGTTCDLSSGRCIQGDRFTAMLKKITGKQVSENKVCPDGKSSCPSGSTCCKLASGSYGCCPLPEAVCCSDGVHCCPNGYSCSGGFCVKGDITLKATKHVAAVKKEATSENKLCPDGKSQCPSGSTCCKLASGGYGCCPYSEAVCCSDGVHCCPHGTTCDLSSGRCIQGDRFTAMLKKITGKQVSENKVCPDGKSSCPSGSTCCKLASGGYGCCPYSEAVCCSDGKHCCPHGTTCEVSSGYCKKGNSVTLMLEKIAAKPISENKLCPDGKSQCPSGSTCCKLASGSYGCCPLPEAVCCSDGVHCCPNGYSCSGGFCVKGDITLKATKHVAAVKKEATSENKLCPDGKSQCPSGSTCCKLASGSYGCCPLPEAVCCSDGVHCCPNGYSCSGGFCVKGDITLKATKHVAAVKKEATSENKLCPDGKSQCPSGSTCCKLASGSYGCCPLPEAVCCSDGVHCCPNGYSCSGGFCVKGDITLKATKHVAAVKKEATSENKLCPDGKSQCPSGSTCCKLASGSYGCCPLPEAVCCSDGVHCCPNGYSCSGGFCVKGDITLKATKHVAAVKKEATSENKLCPDGKSQCPSGSTCCKLASGSYGCCPLPEAVCCSDGVHCCPNGYSCSGGFCVKGDITLKATKHVAAVKKEATSENKLCPDGKSQCPSGSTCCKLASGSYGCCPLPEAVCCSDGVHCCPNGYSCSGGFCVKGDITLKATKHVAAVKKEATSENKLCPDGKSQCPSGSTCCKLASGSYGCCPLPEAVCCSDGVHCCPNGYSCSGGFCMKGDMVLKATEHFPAAKVENEVKTDGSEFITCPDKKTLCVAGTTCCQDKEKSSFSCCPIKDAICCDDHIHCCPNGWKCNTEQGTCYHKKTLQKLPLLKKIPGKKVTADKKKQMQDPYIRF